MADEVRISDWSSDVCSSDLERQVGNLTRLVDDLLEVSRVTRGELDLHCERIELAAIIRTAVESSQPLIDSLGHRLDTKLPPQPIYLRSAERRVGKGWVSTCRSRWSTCQ